VFNLQEFPEAEAEEPLEVEVVIALAPEGVGCPGANLVV